MVIGLLTIAAIPTTIAIAEGISEKDKQKTTNKKKEKKLLRRFRLECWCEGTSPGKVEVHGGQIVVGQEKVWIQSPKHAPKTAFRPFEGFFIEYPDDDRPFPATMGLVSRITDDPPMSNWIYVHRNTREIKHGNRTQSRRHRVGDWGYTNDDDDDDNGGDDEDDIAEVDDDEDPGGVEFNQDERFVAVEAPRNTDWDGRWELYWDENDDKLRNGAEVGGRRVLRVSLERKFVEDE